MNRATIIDLSHPLREPVPCYPGDPRFKMKIACYCPLPTSNEAIDQLNPSMVVRVHELSLGTHTGTHIDAPFHFFPSGQKIHEIPPSRFVGRAVVLDVRHLARDRAMIKWEDVTNGTGTGTGTAMAMERALSRIGSREDGKADIVLLWTGWDVHWGWPMYFSHPYFSQDVAIALHDLGAKVVGVDVLSPDETPVDENTETDQGWAVHEVLLGRDVLICENLKGLGELVGVGSQSDGEGETLLETWVSLMPLSIHNADAAPVRAYGWRQPIARFITY